MVHYVRSKNLPFSVNDVKSITSTCAVCAECKPRFYRPPESYLIKATQPFERISLDFKGPLPSTTNNRFILTVVDEFSRFPFAFPCKDTSASTVIRNLSELFSIFGLPAYVHSDRGSAFMSSELKTFLNDLGIAASRTTRYNPQGNGQCERYNGIIWKSVTLLLRSRKLPPTHWEIVLLDALHNIRSLLSTATNVTPHERLFNYQRRSTSGQAVPTWLTSPGTVLLKRPVRNSKYDQLVDEVELIEANPQYAHVRDRNGREITVSLRDLAPCGTRNTEKSSKIQNTHNSDSDPVTTTQPTIDDIGPPADVEPRASSDESHTPTTSPSAEVAGDPPPMPEPRRSSRVSKPPDRYRPDAYE
jgi:hypothetical protein